MSLSSWGGRVWHMLHTDNDTDTNIDTYICTCVLARLLPIKIICTIFLLFFKWRSAKDALHKSLCVWKFDANSPPCSWCCWCCAQFKIHIINASYSRLASPHYTVVNGAYYSYAALHINFELMAKALTCKEQEKIYIVSCVSCLKWVKSCEAKETRKDRNK